MMYMFARSILLLCCFFSSLLSADDQASPPPAHWPQTEEHSTAAAATESYEYAFLKMLATLGILLILLLISFWMFRRLARGRLRQMNQGKSVKILERRALSPKSILYVVDFCGKRVLIAESQYEICKIDENLPPLSTE
jgi:flagellar biogenesis protein FliO